MLSGIQFAEWYTQVCTVTELISYHHGSYVMKSWSVSIWKKINAW